jgi:Fic family protein
MVSYHFTKTKDIEQELIEIEAIKILFEKLKVLPQIEEKIRRESLLKSSLFSARIEGNPLSLTDIDENDSEEVHQVEIQNLLRAYQYVYRTDFPKTLTIDIIRDLHTQAMKKISLQAGKFRQEPWAIFDASGNAIHLAPPFFEIPKLINQYLEYLNSLTDHPGIIAAISQFIFEKLHPFADGNGRTGRLISALILKQHNYHLRGMLPFEEYTDNHRESYYYALEPSSDMTEFVQYFLTSIIDTSRSILKQLDNRPIPNSFLPSRRQEILAIIADHPNCSFEFLSRRFAAVNPKTLHYDLKKLLDLNLIIKVGITRGALYRRA